MSCLLKGLLSSNRQECRWQHGWQWQSFYWYGTKGKKSTIYSNIIMYIVMSQYTHTQNCQKIYNLLFSWQFFKKQYFHFKKEKNREYIWRKRVRPIYEFSECFNKSVHIKKHLCSCHMYSVKYKNIGNPTHKRANKNDDICLFLLRTLYGLSIYYIYTCNI